MFLYQYMFNNISPLILGGKKIICTNNEINRNNLIDYLRNYLDIKFQELHVKKRTIISTNNLISFTAEKKINLNIPYTDIKITKIKTSAVTEYTYEINIKDANKTIQCLNKELTYNLGKYTKSYVSQEKDKIIIYTHANKAEQIKKDLMHRGELSFKINAKTILKHNSKTKIFENLIIHQSKDNEYIVMMLLSPYCIESLGYWIKKYHKFPVNIIVDGIKVGSAEFERKFNKQIYIKTFKSHQEALGFIYLLNNGPLPNIKIENIEDFQKCSNTSLFLLILQILELLFVLAVCIFLRRYKNIAIFVLSFLFYYYVSYKINNELDYSIIIGGIIHNILFIINIVLNKMKEFTGYITLLGCIGIEIILNVIAKNLYILSLLWISQSVIISLIAILATSFVIEFSFKEEKI